MKSGRDEMVIDPDPDKFTPKEKKRIMKINVMSCTPSSSPSVKYPSDGWGKGCLHSLTLTHMFPC